MGATTVRLNEAFIQTAKVAAQASKSSLSKQVEYWGEISLYVFWKKLRRDGLIFIWFHNRFPFLINT